MVDFTISFPPFLSHHFFPFARIGVIRAGAGFGFSFLRCDHWCTMAGMGPGQKQAGVAAAPFGTTCWSLVLSAGASTSPESQEALATLCQLYWYPIYVYVRRRGYRPDEAEELTQAFFARVLEKKTIRDADPARGRFRSYLLGALKQFLANEWDRQHAQKRGGRKMLVSLDEAEARYSREPAHEQSPERLFDRRWAADILERVFTTLREEYQDDSRQRLFDRLKQCLAGVESDESFRQIGAQLGMTESAVKSAAHRLRRRYRELLRDQIARTVDGPEAVDQEIRDLFDAARG
jgi:RNA polymerase sigma factor (sigma-70 family)